MKILITGANGQLGSELKELTKKFPGWHFLFTDIDELNITDENEVKNYLQQQQPGFVINCAAYTAVDKAESDAQTAEKVNALAPKLLAKYSKITGSKFIHISTDYVFDGESFVPYSEENKVNPKGVYGKTKLQGEINCFEENPDSLVIRTSWLYSTFGNNFVKTMLRLAGERDKLNVVFDQVGTPTNAADLADAILSIIQISVKYKEKFVPGIYNYSNEGVASWYDFAKAIFEIACIKCEVSPVLSDQFPTPAKRPNYSVLNKSKIKNTFGLVIPYWKESLKICLDKINNTNNG